jgi:hypothetical protein
MAEFNLGRIRFVWKGTWVSSTTYIKDDIVRFGGKTYLCISGHVADLDFYTNLNSVPSKWNQLSDGQNWAGDWLAGTVYKTNDIVKYGGYVYICKNPHTAATFVAPTWLGLEANQNDWEIFAESFDWKTDWAVSTRYKVNDIVKHGGIAYICNENHVSAATITLGLEDDQSKWDYLHKGIEYRSTWSASSVRYRINDVVKYGAGLWICTTYHTSSATFAESNWEQFVEGLEFNDTWTESTVYQPGDTISYGGYVYISKTNNTNQVPTSNSDDWDLYITGFKYQGGWGIPNFYEVGNVVRFGGYTYVTVADHEASGSNLPPNATYWAQLNSGFEWKNAWETSAPYKLGDIVKFGPSSFICILPHVSSTPSRPDNDSTGTYWNGFTTGFELAVLTTLGDIAYYGGAGPTRLAIGAPGQVLKVSDTSAPTWGYFGALNQIYYVATSGADVAAPENGITLDKPWKTIQYAMQQIDRGAAYPAATNLLERNRQFVQKEVTAWIAVQIAGSIAPFVGGFLYNTAKCERDIGLIIDALAYDLSHGGNSKIRQAALSYGSEAAQFYILGQSEETVAAINYGLTVIDAVISNVAPATVYQGTVTQVTDLTKVEEVGALSILTNLVSALTNAITSADDSSAIFNEVTVNYTLSVKTGTLYEVLPIVVPKNTAIVGDELRSTNIQPAGSLIAAGDVTYSLSALTRISTLISNVIQNIAITKTPSNTLNPITSRPAGSTGAGSAAATLLANAIAYIDFYVNASGTAPIMLGTNYWSTDENYYNAINVLEENKEFFAEEAVAYIDTTYPLYAGTYDTDACKRDIREYINAAKWDLIYNSNYKTLTAAKIYTNAVNGSITKDMFYFRQGTGLRNCTVQGLTGTLSAVNGYGTKRPTAGAYASLDPGWGPDDERVWITTRSPYIQNVTTFGTACIGLKVDGDLHNGGNDSIVANDFTQIISDGIGAWVTNLGRAELVSVFSYYAHIGYLAENGGKVRATNGNSSYGTFGTVSEGIDSTETPIIAKIDNRSIDALIGSVFTDSTNQIYRFEYTNAGIDYSNATYTINGAGTGLITVADEFRDDAVFDVRLTDPGDSSGTGGSGYLTASNTAQTGNSTSVTLAATDSATSTQYVGMRIIILSGAGVGQVGYIQAYNSGSKIATIYKESTGTAGWDHVVPGTTIASSLDITSGYIIEPRLTFTGPSYTSTARTIQSAAWTDVVYGDLNATYTGITTTGGSGTSAQFTVVKAGNYYTVTNTTPGVGYKINDVLTIAGTNVGGLSPANDITITINKVITGGVNSFEISGVAAGGRYVAVGTTTSSYSTNGTTWTAGGAIGITAIDVAYGNGTWIAISSTGTTAISTDGGTTWSAGGAAPAGTYTNINYGNGRWIAIGTTTTAAYSTTDGVSWVAMTGLPSASWTDVAYGGGTWVAVASSGTVAASSTNGTSWTSRTISSGNWGSVIFGKNMFIAMPAGGTLTSGAYSLNGTTWSTMTVPSATYSKVSYGQGLFFAVSASTAAASSEDGINWTSRTMSASANGYSSVAFGNPNRTGTWAAVQAGTAGTVASSHQLGCMTYARAVVADEKIIAIRVIEPGSGYTSAPALTITDPNNTVEASTSVRIGDGVLANPTFNNRGTLYTTATATVTGNGSIDMFQTGSFIAVKGLTGIPRPGSNIQINGINDVYYKLVTVTALLSQGDYYTAILQFSPAINANESPVHLEATTIRVRYSQVRLTGHDFLEIGTGNFASTNYPGLPFIDPIPSNETVESGGGRVFYTSTDQDGNFRVGDIFSVEQSTGIATLNADAFNIAGLQELSLGAVSLGGSGAVITEFSTDPFFTADSDSVIPTQRAIKAYISAQIGSGAAQLTVNTLTAGVIFISGDTITTTTGAQININTKMNFTAGIDGYALAYQLFY